MQGKVQCLDGIPRQAQVQGPGKGRIAQNVTGAQVQREQVCTKFRKRAHSDWAPVLQDTPQHSAKVGGARDRGLLVQKDERLMQLEEEEAEDTDEGGKRWCGDLRVQAKKWSAHVHVEQEMRSVRVLREVLSVIVLYIGQDLRFGTIPGE